MQFFFENNLHNVPNVMTFATDACDVASHKL